MKNYCTVYLIFRIFIGFLDIGSDILLSVHLILEDHLYWGLAVAGWVGFAFLMSVLAVLVERCRRGVPMSPCKYILMSLKIHAEIGEAFFQSGPQLITQLVILWSGIHQHDFETYIGSPSLDWAWAWLEVFSVTMSLISLDFTAVRYNNEPEPGTRVFWSALCSIFTSLYRVFIISIILVLDPMISSIILLSVFLVTVGLYRCWGDSSSCLPHAYYSMFLPVGHTQASSVKAGYISATSGVPESERSKINQEGLLRRIEKFFASHLILSLLLLVPYFTFLELWLHSSLQPVSVLPILHNRYFTHTTALGLLLLTLMQYLCYYLEARKARNAARAWTGMNSTLIEQPKVTSPLTSISEPKLPVSEDWVDTNPTPSSPRPQFSSNQDTSRIDRERSASLFDPTPARVSSPTMSRPCSMLYPYLPSAPAPSECGDLDTLPRQLFPGSRKCDDEECITCAWIKEGPNFFSNVTRRQYKFMTPVTCTEGGLIYLVTCDRCRKQFVGKAENSLREKNAEHRVDIEKQGSLLGRHFGSVCGYENWSLQIIDKCSQKELVRRERYWQEELTTVFPVGLNETNETRK
eukprot:GFUD01021948.1.p1 GENE.GFUD01021948.1~~GFUD01021948.1.p1  ORF type:complete len:578 (+),score=103.58 GFUD01021948.1:72-1805(+)